MLSLLTVAVQAGVDDHVSAQIFILHIFHQLGRWFLLVSSRYKYHCRMLSHKLSLLLLIFSVFLARPFEDNIIILLACFIHRSFLYLLKLLYNPVWKEPLLPAASFSLLKISMSSSIIFFSSSKSISLAISRCVHCFISFVSFPFLLMYFWLLFFPCQSGIMGSLKVGHWPVTKQDSGKFPG